MVDNKIKIGDTVYIGGLLGKESEHLNNKLGVLQNVMFTSAFTYSTLIADVQIKNKVFPINLSYVYDIEFFDTINYIPTIVDEVNPLLYYYRKYNVVGYPLLVHDEFGKSTLLCKTRENNIKPLMLTSLN